LFFFGVVEDEGPVAADAAHHRLDDTERGGNGNGRIEGVAALREDLQTRLRRKRVCGTIAEDPVAGLVELF